MEKVWDTGMKNVYETREHERVREIGKGGNGYSHSEMEIDFRLELDWKKREAA